MGPGILIGHQTLINTFSFIETLLENFQISAFSWKASRTELGSGQVIIQ